MQTIHRILIAGLTLLMVSPPAFGGEPAHRDRQFPLVQSAGAAKFIEVGRRGFRGGGRHRGGGFRGGWGYRGGGFRGGWGYRGGPRWGSGFSFSFGAPLFWPRYNYPGPVYPYPSYYPPVRSYAPPPAPPQATDHCTSILNYAEQRTLPPGWTVDAFNQEVERCRALKYLALSGSYVPPLPPRPLTAAPQNSSYFGDELACRDMATQASGGGSGVGRTVEGGLVGGALGAAAGAAIGAVAGDPGIGAAIGAIAGGFTGAASGNAQAGQDFYTVYGNCMALRGHR